MTRFHKRLSLTNRDCEQLISTLDLTSGSSAIGPSRSHVRHPYRMADIPMWIEHPDGGRSLFLVYSRNLSRGGISFLHGGYLHNDSDCRIILRDRAMKPIALPGVVRHCRLISGSCHEIGVQFKEEINTAQLLVEVEYIEDDAARTNENQAPQPLTGTVLIAEHFEPDRLLLEHQLKQLGLKTFAVPTCGTALSILKNESVDLVLTGLSLLLDDGIRLIHRMRAQEYTNPIIVMTPDDRPATLTAALNAGADEVIIKPFNAELLHSLLVAFLDGSDEPAPLRSSIVHHPGMKDLISRYLDQVHQVSRQIRIALAEDDWGAVRALCCNLKGSGLTYGFHHLTVMAMKAIAAIDVEHASTQTMNALDPLLDYCDRLQASSPSAA